MPMPLYTIRHMLPTRDFRAFFGKGVVERCRLYVSSATGISGRPDNRIGSLGIRPNCSWRKPRVQPPLRFSIPQIPSVVQDVEARSIAGGSSREARNYLLGE